MPEALLMQWDCMAWQLARRLLNQCMWPAINLEVQLMPGSSCHTVCSTRTAAAGGSSVIRPWRAPVDTPTAALREHLFNMLKLCIALGCDAMHLMLRVLWCQVLPCPAGATA